MCLSKHVSAGFKFQLADCLFRNMWVDFDLAAIVLCENVSGCLFGHFRYRYAYVQKRFGMRNISGCLLKLTCKSMKHNKVLQQTSLMMNVTLRYYAGFWVLDAGCDTVLDAGC